MFTVAVFTACSVPEAAAATAAEHGDMGTEGAALVVVLQEAAVAAALEVSVQ